MVERIIAAMLRQRGAAVALALIIIGAGVYSYLHLSIDAFPDVTNIQVDVVSYADGLSAVEIERSVTYPIEMSMRGLPGVVAVGPQAQSRQPIKMGKNQENVQVVGVVPDYTIIHPDQLDHGRFISATDVNNKSRVAVEPKERQALFDQIAARVAKDRPIIYLFHRHWLWAYANKVTGLRAVPDGMVRLQGLRFQ